MPKWTTSSEVAKKSNRLERYHRRQSKEPRRGHGKQEIRKLFQGEEPRANQGTFPIFGIEGLGNIFPA